MTPVDFAPDGGEDNWHNWWQCLAAGHFSSARWLQVAHQAPPECTRYPNVSTHTAPFKLLNVSLRKAYWAIAQEYELGDSFFAVSSTDSFPAHQYIVAGQSRTDAGDTVAGQPYYTGGGPASGCLDLGQPGISVYYPRLGHVANPVQNGFAPDVTRGVDGECWNPKTFADQLTEANVEWDHFSTIDGVPNVFNGFININGKNGQKWYAHVFPNSGTNVLNVAWHGKLRQFSWIKPPCLAASDHPNTGNNGPAWVETIVDAIGNNKPQWEHAAIFVIWDDWGGFYDHRTPPPTRGFDGMGPGLRTPFLLISPYVVKGNVAHGVANYGSILRFVEELYSVPSMHRVDAFSPDLVGFFDFNQTPRPFATITAVPTWSPQTGCTGNNTLARD
jgi:phospholipase C